LLGSFSVVVLSGARSYREGCVAYEDKWLPEHLVGDDPWELREVHESLRGPSKSEPLRIVSVVRPAGVCGRLAAQYSKRSEVLPFRDLAAGEAFAQDLLRRIPGRARFPVSPPSREEAPHDQGDEHEQPYPEQERDEDPGPKKTAAVTSAPRRTAAPIVPGLDEEEAVASAKHRALAREAAQKAIVLLKNEPVDGQTLLPWGHGNLSA
jgi:hypothetical protein